MNNRQKFAIIAPLLLIVVMYPIFQLLSGAFGETIGWYLGLVIYWLIWGTVFPLAIIGKESIRTIIRWISDIDDARPARRVMLIRYATLM